jgi:molybdate transport system substrate-binding protein
MTLLQRLAATQRGALFLILSLSLTTAAHAETITISAAISLKDALTAIAKTFESDSTDKIEFNFGASGPLAAQIQQGAPVDAFISAANKQVDDLIKSGKADANTRRIIVQNTLVLIVPAAATNPPQSFTDLTADRVGKIALGQPKAVPAGQYAMETLQNLKLADALSAKIVYGANDAKVAGDTVKTVATAPASSHEPIEYPAIILTAATHQSAAIRFLTFLQSDQAKSIFISQGFVLPAAPTTQSRP